MTRVLYSILNDLSLYKDGDKSEILKRRVQERLEKSYQIYYQEVEQSINFLKFKHEKSLIKRMNKMDE